MRFAIIIPLCDIEPGIITGSYLSVWLKHIGLQDEVSVDLTVVIRILVCS